MRKLSGLMVILLSVILVSALILGGCSSGTSTTPATTTAAPPASTSAAPPTTTAKPPTTTTAAPPASTTSAPPASTTAAAGGTIKIGLVSAYSGVFAAVAPYWLEAVKEAVDEANASGGVMGKQIELVTRDDQGDPSIAVQKANELKAAGVVAIIGSLIESSDEALFGWTKDAHIPLMVSQSPAVASRTKDFNKYSFFPCPISTAWAKVAEQTVINNNYKSVYFMAGDQTIAHELHDNFWALINKDKPGTVTDKGFTLLGVGDMDFSSSISAIISKKPDVLITIMGGPPFAAFMQQAQQFNLYGQVKALGWNMISPDNVTPFGKNFPTGLQSMNDTPYYMNTPEMTTWVKAYNARTKGLYPADITLPFYIGTVDMIQAIKSANSTDPDAIVKALETTTFTSPVGSITYSDYDHQAHMPIWVATSGFSNDFPIAIGLNPVKYLDGLYMTKDEVLAARAAK